MWGLQPNLLCIKKKKSQQGQILAASPDTAQKDSGLKLWTVAASQCRQLTKCNGSASYLRSAQNHHLIPLQ